MDEDRITTEAQLDAAVSALRRKRIEGLRRLANMNLLWFVGCLIPQAYFLYAYLSEGYVPSTMLIIILVVSPIVGYFGLLQKKQEAARQLKQALSE